WPSAKSRRGSALPRLQSTLPSAVAVNWTQYWPPGARASLNSVIVSSGKPTNGRTSARGGGGFEQPQPASARTGARPAISTASTRTRTADVWVSMVPSLGAKRSRDIWVAESARFRPAGLTPPRLIFRGREACRRPPQHPERHATSRSRDIRDTGTESGRGAEQGGAVPGRRIRRCARRDRKVHGER